MAVPLRYNARNLIVRWRSTLATVLGIALVVAVYVMVMALERGLRNTYVTTGDENNLLVLRRGSTSETSSQVTHNDHRRIKYLDGIARNDRGEPMASAEIIILIYLDRVDQSGGANVLLRGMGPMGLELRPKIKLVEGRMVRPGMHECVVSKKIAARFANCRVGDTFRAGKFFWKVVGIFDASKTAFDSEIWVDADEAREAFNRDFYGSVLIRPVDDAIGSLLAQRESWSKKLKELKEADRDATAAKLAEVEQAIGRTLVGRIEADRQLQVRVLSERSYYEEQTRTGMPIWIMGWFLSTIMSIGAAFSAMNTMYAAIGRRTREIGTLRVLGFKRREIYACFMLESILIAVVGGIVGCLLSLPLNGIATGTFSWTTFSEVAFEFRITPELLGKGMVFALVMGVVGALLPARLAARKPVLDALRAV